MSSHLHALIELIIVGLQLLSADLVLVEQILSRWRVLNAVKLFFNVFLIVTGQRVDTTRVFGNEFGDVEEIIFVLHDQLFLD